MFDNKASGRFVFSDKLYLLLYLFLRLIADEDGLRVWVSRRQLLDVLYLAVIEEQQLDIVKSGLGRDVAH